MNVSELQIGDELPSIQPDTSLDRVRRFVRASGMDFPRFTDNEAARREGLPGALVPGIMSQGFLAVMIHAWAPGARIRSLDTVFRNPIVVGTEATCAGSVTDVDVEERTVEVDLTMVDAQGVTAVLGTALVELAD